MASTVTSHWVISTTSQNFPKSSQLSHRSLLHLNTTNFHLSRTVTHLSRFSVPRPRAAQTDQEATSSVLLQEVEQASKEVEESVRILKNAAKTRKVAAEEVLAALAVIEKAKLDPSEFLNTLGGSESPGRTWMLIFTAKDRLKSGSYFPITAVQRFDAAGKRIENGVFFGPFGCLTFEGRFSWKKRILAFIFECIRIKVGPFGPLQISLGQIDEREPSTKEDPFFIWFYIDEEIAVARGRSGGTAFWCRCRRVT
ncbi:uncharacterized protein LOC122078938 [Macadamia integrifolia]|uniref:uncharacterized protein LOC122078938 n=1 Tax=Macadamia integrifolia TaxID=60698 RepID=UPI001C4F3EA2|nr:uncharacterized protein LOC122078938 [Macadamia integrifolia]